MAIRWQLVRERFIPAGDTQAGPFDRRGRMMLDVVASGELDELAGSYLVRIALWADGREHPLADVPFSLDRGRWVWFPPAVDVDELDELDDAGEPGGWLPRAVPIKPRHPIAAFYGGLRSRLKCGRKTLADRK